MKTKFNEEKEKTLNLLEKDHHIHAEKRKAEMQKVIGKASQELSKVE
jgi:hypothetical protein